MVLLRILEKDGIRHLKGKLFIREYEGIHSPEIRILAFVLHRRMMEHLAGLGRILDLVVEH